MGRPVLSLLFQVLQVLFALTSYGTYDFLRVFRRGTVHVWLPPGMEGRQSAAPAGTAVETAQRARLPEKEQASDFNAAVNAVVPKRFNATGKTLSVVYRRNFTWSSAKCIWQPRRMKAGWLPNGL
jgi:hypothetical protein